MRQRFIKQQQGAKYALAASCTGEKVRKSRNVFNVQVASRKVGRAALQALFGAGACSLSTPRPCVC